jgi:hypothetical protein
MSGRAEPRENWYKQVPKTLTCSSSSFYNIKIYKIGKSKATVKVLDSTLALPV